ncbi:hypothetical protein CLIB1444_10S03598 [[Candida] jaroonii]|uniref:Uncharacterized protein n=1 Tax=[Candida] jaroonii TaxID=467808 RepID=A0ACA9YDY2_9ASCO|nr:hypothetical protein CLIB1444_10S03598 [[Candida] jaroonii]
MNTQEVIDEYLSRSFKDHPRLRDPSQFRILSYCIQNIYGKKNSLFCIDVEAWERNTKIVTEIGICIYDPSNQELSMVPSFHTYHIRIRENYHRKNGRFVPDHVSNFAGLNTYVMTMEDAVTFIKLLIEKYFVNSDNPCNLVGHDLNGDIKWFKTLGIEFPSNIIKVDTQFLMSLSTQKQRSLSKSLALVGIPHSFLHNAGNDAYYTLVLALKLSDPQSRTIHGLDDGKNFPLDIEHEKRHKNRCPELEVDDPLLLMEELHP